MYLFISYQIKSFKTYSQKQLLLVLRIFYYFTGKKRLETDLFFVIFPNITFILSINNSAIRGLHFYQVIELIKHRASFLFGFITYYFSLPHVFSLSLSISITGQNYKYHVIIGDRSEDLQQFPSSACRQCIRERYTRRFLIIDSADNGRGQSQTKSPRTPCVTAQIDTLPLPQDRFTSVQRIECFLVHSLVCHFQPER